VEGLEARSVEPLRWPDFYEPRRHPIILFSRRAAANWRATVQDARAQLQARPSPSADRWGTGDCRRDVGQTLCSLVQRTYDWPNDHFIPEDPVDVVFLMPDDDLEIVEVILEFQKALGVRLPDVHAKLETCKLLGDFVEVLAVASGC
jgi:hypothetical protein